MERLINSKLIDEIELEISLRNPERNVDSVVGLCTWVAMEEDVLSAQNDGRIDTKSLEQEGKQILKVARFNARINSKRNARENGIPYAAGLLMHYARRRVQRTDYKKPRYF